MAAALANGEGRTVQLPPGCLQRRAQYAKIKLLVFAHRLKLRLYKGLSRICPDFSAEVFFGKSLSNLCQVQVQGFLGVTL